MASSDVTFIRKRGRIIPIKKKKGKGRKRGKSGGAGLALGAIAGTAALGLGAVVFKRFRRLRVLPPYKELAPPRKLLK